MYLPPSFARIGTLGLIAMTALLPVALPKIAHANPCQTDQIANLPVGNLWTGFNLAILCSQDQDAVIFNNNTQANIASPVVLQSGSTLIQENENQQTGCIQQGQIMGDAIASAFVDFSYDFFDAIAEAEQEVDQEIEDGSCDNSD